MRILTEDSLGSYWKVLKSFKLTIRSARFKFNANVRRSGRVIRSGSRFVSGSGRQLAEMVLDGRSRLILFFGKKTEEDERRREDEKTRKHADRVSERESSKRAIPTCFAFAAGWVDLRSSFQVLIPDLWRSLSLVLGLSLHKRHKSLD